VYNLGKLDQDYRLMATPNPNLKPALGFLTVLNHPQHGLFGGYLILSLTGRPLEFHCTTPIKPNRAQEILYGPTLESFLYGEQIGFTLLGQAKIEPLIVCTDSPPVLALRELISLPVALVLPADQAGSNPAGHPNGESGPGARGPAPDSPRATFRVGRNTLAVHQRPKDDQAVVTERLAELDDCFDLSEPFERIRAAIEEAQQAAR
jgi:hypothetical protein